MIDGSFFQGASFDVMLAYGQVKYLGALWMGAMARMHPELRFHHDVRRETPREPRPLRDAARARADHRSRILLP